MKYAIIQTGGKQYKIKQDTQLVVDRLEEKEGKKIAFPEVLLAVDDGKIKIGQPLLRDVAVSGVTISHMKGKKIRVAIYKAKSRYRKVIGHRQQQTLVRIEDIVIGKPSKTA